MKHVISIILCLTACLSLQAKRVGDVRQQPADSVTVCQLLAEAKKQPASTNLPLFFAKKFIGRPYVASTLEGDAEERLYYAGGECGGPHPVCPEPTLQLFCF